MQITRKQGIFNIQFDTEKADFEAKLNYNKLGFICDILIPIIDSLKETNQYKKELKFHSNRTLAECEKIVDEHVGHYHYHGMIDDEKNSIHSVDIYNITAKAYEEAFKFFTERQPSEVASIMEIIRKAEEKGLKLQDINIEYKQALV